MPHPYPATLLLFSFPLGSYYDAVPSSLLLTPVLSTPPQCHPHSIDRSGLKDESFAVAQAVGEALKSGVYDGVFDFLDEAEAADA